MSKDQNGDGATKRCRKCGEEVLGIAKMCKHCKTDLRSWPMRHKILSAFMLLFLVPPFLGFVFSAAGTSSEGDKPAVAAAMSEADFQASLPTDKPKVQAFWDDLKDKLKDGDDTDEAVQKSLQNPSSGYEVYQRLSQAASIDDALSDQIADLAIPDLADDQSEQMLKDGIASLSSAYNAKKYAYEEFAKFINSAATSSDYEKMTSQKTMAMANLGMASQAVSEGIAKVVIVMTKYGVSVE